MSSYKEDSEQKKRWRAEKEQLQADLASREKIIRKREVSLKFGKKFQSKATPLPTKAKLPTDTYLRHQLGL